MRATLALALAMSVIAVPAARGATFTPQQIIDAVNEERAANGIPGDLTENPTMTSDCFAHNEYAVRHGGYDPSDAHNETQPDKTNEGINGGQHSVLATGAPWSDGDPWETAPYHLVQVMDPRLKVTGADEHGEPPFDCLWTHTVDPNGVPNPRAPPATGTIWTFPGDGRANVPWFEYTDSEFPQSPNDTLGLPRSQPTSFAVQAYWDGPSSDPQLLRLCAATVTPRGGAARSDTRIIHAANGPVGDGQGLIVNEQPLDPSTTYDLAATFSTTVPCDAAAANRQTRAFSFTTEPKQPVEQMVHIADLAPSPSGSGASRLAWDIDEPLTRGSGHIVLSSTGYLTTTDTGFWGSGFFEIPPPPAGQSVTLTITNDPFTIGTTTWGATPVARTFSGPAGPAPATPTSTQTTVVQPVPQPLPQPIAVIAGGAAAGRATVGSNRIATLATRVDCSRSPVACPYTDVATAAVTSSRAVSTAKRRKARPVKIGSFAGTVPAGRTSRVQVKLTAKGLKLLKRARRLRAQVVISVPSAGRVSTRTVKVTLAPARRRR